MQYSETIQSFNITTLLLYTLSEY